MERLTKRTANGKAVSAKSYSSSYIAAIDQEEREFESERLERLCELEDKLESGEFVALPNGWLDTLKLLTVAAMCYADIKHLLENCIKDSKEIADLYFQCPNVQGSTNLWALSSLAESKLDCNKIKGFEEILNAMPNFKEIVNKQS